METYRRGATAPDDPKPYRSGALYTAQIKRQKQQAQAYLAKAYLIATNQFSNDIIVTGMVGVSREIIRRYYRPSST